MAKLEQQIAEAEEATREQEELEESHSVAASQLVSAGVRSLPARHQAAINDKGDNASATQQAWETEADRLEALSKAGKPQVRVLEASCLTETVTADAHIASATEEHGVLALERTTDHAAMASEVSAVNAIQRVANEEEASARSATVFPSSVMTTGEIPTTSSTPQDHEESSGGEAQSAEVDTLSITMIEAVRIATEEAAAARESVEVIKDSLIYTEAQLFDIAAVLEEATLQSDATKIDDARALQADLKATLLGQQREEAKLCVAFLAASQVEKAAIDSATPGGAIFNREEQHQPETRPPPVTPNLLGTAPPPQANKVHSNRRSSRIQGLGAILPCVPGQSVSAIESTATPVPPRKPGQYSQEAIRASRESMVNKHDVPHSSNRGVGPL